MKKILEDEEKHEQELLDMLDEERLEYVGSMVLGLNDALALILTMAMAGLSLGVAALSFGIGILVREVLGVEL